MFFFHANRNQTKLSGKCREKNVLSWSRWFDLVFVYKNCHYRTKWSESVVKAMPDQLRWIKNQLWLSEIGSVETVSTQAESITAQNRNRQKKDR